MRTYTTKQGDTWDEIALAVYGNENAVRDMMAENGVRHPEYLKYWRFPAGVPLLLPDITGSSVEVSYLPEYRRPE